MSKSKSIQDKKYECRVCNSCYPFRYIECPNCKRSGDIWELVEQSKDKRYTEKQNRLTKEDQERLLPKFRNVEQSKEEQCDSDPLGPMIYGTKPKTEEHCEEAHKEVKHCDYHCGTPKTEDTGECDFDFSKMSPGVQCLRCSLKPCGKDCPYRSAPLNKDWEETNIRAFLKELVMQVQGEPFISMGGKDQIELALGRILLVLNTKIESARASERKKIDTEKILRDVEEELAKSGTYKYEEIHGALMFKYRVDELLSKIEK